MTSSSTLPATTHANISGMHCGNCVAMVERIIKAQANVTSAQVTYPPGLVIISHTGPLDAKALATALKSEGYTFSITDAPVGGNGRYLEILATFVVLIGIVFILQHFALIPRGFSVSDEMSYGLAFVIGLVASVSSCLAVTGGLLVALAAKYNEANPYLTERQRFLPHLYFNVGRILSYTLLGGAIGALGATLSLSSAVSGFLTLFASLIMIVLGFNMLGLLPGIGHYLPALPRAFTDKLRNAAAIETKGAFLLGAGTFFLPCGFTQALQLYALGKASFTVGALTMLAFAFGTLPALLSLSAVSSLAKGAAQKQFLRVAGVAVVLLGVLNIQYGLVLTGSDLARSASASSSSVTAEMQFDGSSQRMVMKVIDLEYSPSQFAVKQGVPVQWWIDGSQAAGCGRALLSPSLGIQQILSDKSMTLITFTPEVAGDYPFNCGMGMMTPDAKITVVPKG